MSVTGSIRFVIGIACVAGGTVLCSPLVAKLVTAAGADAVPSAPLVPPPLPSVVQPVAPPAPHLSPQPATVPPGVVDPWAGAVSVPPADSAGGLQFDRCPPPPPAPLPPLPAEMVRTAPVMGGAYRSTLDVPPPPLLDAQHAPPPVTWAAPAAPAVLPVAASVAVTAAEGEMTVPATYRVRDGDDLGGIAARFYGHPSAASVIWAANRETVAHPDLLPIGAELRLPPAWAARGRRQSSSGAIEPAAYARPVPAVDGGMPRGGESAPWLGAATALPPPALLPDEPRSPPAVAPAAASRVVVGAGETMASLARRIYGDPGMATEIFAVNRDRLRSPDLLVAGMELRLPRPVVIPRQP